MKSAGGAVQLYSCNKSNAQSWIVNSNGTIENKNGACLDLAGASKLNNTHIVIYGCNTNAAQQWKLENNEIVNPGSGKCIDDPYSTTANNTQLILYTCKTTSNQKWIKIASSSTSGGSSTTGSETSSSTSGGCTNGGVVAPCIGGTTTGASGWGTPKFDDEFNATSVDTAKWQTSCPDWDGALNGGNIAANVSESGGSLILVESAAGKGACVESSIATSTSGFRLNGYGFAEARILFPGNGSTVYDWPAWWTVGAADNTIAPNNTTGDETDIAEGLSGTLTTTQHSWHTSGCLNKDNGCQQSIPSKGSYGGAYHIFGMDREVGKTTIYYDGVSIGTLNTNDGGKPIWLVLNIGDGPYGGSKEYGTSGAMKVDYVRVWQK